MSNIDARIAALERAARAFVTPELFASLVRAAGRGELQATIAAIEASEGRPLASRLVERAERVAVQMRAMAAEMDRLTAPPPA